MTVLTTEQIADLNDLYEHMPELGKGRGRPNPMLGDKLALVDIGVDLSDLLAAAAELNLVDGSLVGAVVNSKAAIYDAAGKLYRSSATVAAVGTLISDAAVMTAELNAVTGANGTAGVKLPVAAAGEIVIVINTDASNALKVWPVAASQINALGASAAFTVTPGQVAVFIGRSATLWYTAAATDTVAGLTSSAAELNKLDGVTGGTTPASLAVVTDAQKAVDTLRATTDLNVGGTGVPGAASVETTITKAITAFTDTVAKAIFTVTIPNAAHAAVIEVDVLAKLGAGGAIGAGEGSRASKYQVVLARTAGVNVVATASAAIGGAEAHVAGAASITSAVVTVGAVVGAVGASNTFTIELAITKSGGASDNHTCTAAAKVLNANATGVTIA